MIFKKIIKRNTRIFCEEAKLAFEANEEQYWVKKKLNLNFETGLQTLEYWEIIG